MYPKNVHIKKKTKSLGISNERNMIQFMFKIEILPKKIQKKKELDVPKKSIHRKKTQSLAISNEHNMISFMFNFEILP